MNSATLSQANLGESQRRSSFARYVVAASVILVGIGTASASHREVRTRVVHRHDVNVSGSVEIVKQVPGGSVRVGVEVGRPRPDVVVVERREPQPREVVVVERPREPEVVVIEKRRAPKVVVVERPARCERTVVVERRESCDREWDWRNESFRYQRECEFRHLRGGNVHVYDNGNSFTYSNQEHGSREHYYRDAHQVSYDYEGPEGRYHYFENGQMVSIDDNRHGSKQHVFYNK